MKTCTKCGEIKTPKMFNKSKRNCDGLSTHCKACSNAQSAAWLAANADWKKSTNADWYAANKEQRKVTMAAWREANTERVAAQQKMWRLANPDKCRVLKQNRRARKLKSGGRLSIDLSARLFKLQRGKCACCGKPLGDDYHMDHIMPLALGGTNTDSNAQLLRAKCNLQKSAKHPVDFMQQRGFLL